MSEVRSSSEVPDSRNAVTSSDAIPQVDKVGKSGKGNQRGSGSRKKRYDKMRDSKNAKAEADRFNNLISKYDLDADTQGYCSAMMVGPSPSYPARTVNIKCETAVSNLVNATVVFLESRKLQLPPTAAADLRDVTRMQIRAKEVMARRGSGKAMPSDFTAVGVERTMKHLYRAPHAIAFYLSNIGKIDYRGQKIYPLTDIPMPDPPGTNGMTKTEIMNDRCERLYVRLTEEGHRLFPPGRNLTIHDISQPNVHSEMLYAHDSFDSMDSIINRYHVLLNMIERKFSYLVEDIDFSDAIGTTAQLVGTTLVRDETYTAHCTVPVVDHMLAIGAGCGFGLQSSDPFHSLENAYMMRDTNPGNFFTEIQDKRRPPRDDRV